MMLIYKLVSVSDLRKIFEGGWRDVVFRRVKIIREFFISVIMVEGIFKVVRKIFW